MKIVEKNTGKKIDYELNGNVLSIDNSFMLNLARYERDDEVNIDICKTPFDILVMGVIPGFTTSYVAQITIPPKKYVFKDVKNGDDVDQTKEAVPFDVDMCTLTLWAIKEA